MWIYQATRPKWRLCSVILLSGSPLAAATRWFRKASARPPKVARAMLAKGYDRITIMELTGLKEDELRAITDDAPSLTNDGMDNP